MTYIESQIPGDVLLCESNTLFTRQGTHYLVIDKSSGCTGSRDVTLLELSRNPRMKKPFPVSYEDTENRNLFRRVETYYRIYNAPSGSRRTLDAVLEVTEGRIARFISEK